MNIKEKLLEFYRLKDNNALRQSGIYFSVQLMIVFMGYFIKVLQTRTLGPEDYGLYAFFGTLTAILVILFNFGLFPALQVILAENTDKTKERQLKGLGFIITALLGIAFSGVLLVLSFFVDQWFGIEFGQLLRIVSILCAILPFRYLIQAIGVGTNNITWFAFYDLFSKAWFLLTIILVWQYSEITLLNLMLLNMSGFFVALILMWKTLAPAFSGIKQHIPELISKTRSYGLNYYWGFIANVSTYKFDEIFISYLVNTTQLGFYNLASIICSPMVMLSQAVSASMFKQFAHSNKIPSKLFFYNTCWLVFCVVFLWLTADLIVQVLFGEAYMQVADYILPLSIAYLFTGLYHPYLYLAAKSQGKAIRNIAFAEAFVNLSGNIILIPMYGVMGAIYATIFAKFINFIGKAYYYNQYLKGKGE